MIAPVIIGGTVIVTKGLKEKFGSRAGRSFNVSTTENINTLNITRHTESTAV
jgi:hypothetical protein